MLARPGAASSSTSVATAKGRSFSPIFHRIRQADGEVSHFLAIQEDITERKRTAENWTATVTTCRNWSRNARPTWRKRIAACRFRTQRLNALFEMSQKAPDLDEEALLQLGVNKAVRLTGSAIGYLHLVHEDQENVRLYLWSSGTYAHCDALPLSHYPLSSAGIWADAARERQPVMHKRLSCVDGRWRPAQRPAREARATDATHGGTGHGRQRTCAC